MKKIKPTPKSITHKKPIKTSISFIKNRIPETIKYTPAVKRRIVTLKTYVKTKIVEKRTNSTKKQSKKTNYTDFNQTI